VQYISWFQAGDPPPYYAPDTPLYNSTFTVEEKAVYDLKKANQIKAKDKRTDTRVLAFMKKHPSMNRVPVIQTLSKQDEVIANSKASKAAIKLAQKT